MADAITIRRIGVEELPIIQQLAEEIWPHAFDGVIQRHQIEIMLGDIYATEALENEIEGVALLDIALEIDVIAERADQLDHDRPRYADRAGSLEQA